jgi:uncharacterized Rmd1/YagE family protein
LLLLLRARLNRRHKHALCVKRKRVITGTLQAAVEVVGRTSETAVVVTVVIVVVVESVVDKRRLEIKNGKTAC